MLSRRHRLYYQMIYHQGVRIEATKAFRYSIECFRQYYAGWLNERFLLSGWLSRLWWLVRGSVSLGGHSYGR